VTSHSFIDSNAFVCLPRPHRSCRSDFFPIEYDAAFDPRFRIGHDERSHRACPKGHFDFKIGLVHDLRRRLRDPDEDLPVPALRGELLLEDFLAEPLLVERVFAVPDRDEPRLLPRFVCR